MADAPIEPGAGVPELSRRRFVERFAAMTAASAAGLPLAGRPVWASPPHTADGSPPGALRASHAAGQALEAIPTPLHGRIEDLTVAEAAAMLRRRELSAAEYLEALLTRIERLDPVLRAFNALPAERARAAAAAFDRRDRDLPAGALAGVPLAVKDNFRTAGVPTTANSRLFQGYVPDYDATAWANLAAAGAILIGKTQMGPLATTRATTPAGERTTVSAWAPEDPDVSPGGSSSGSATAVAAGLAPGSTGTQTGGSITNPSESQGLTGLKPTFGRVSLYGIIPLTYTRDHPGPLARDALDAALLLSSMAGPDPLDPRSLGHPPLPDLVEAATPVRSGGQPRLRWPLRIGLFPDALDGPSPPEQEENETEDLSDEARARRRGRYERELAEVAARRVALEALEDAGAELVEVRPPEDWDTLTSWSFNNVRLPERSEIFLDELRDDVRKFGVSLGTWINGLLLPAAEYVRGQRARLLLLERILDGPFTECDLLVQSQPFPFDMVGLPLITFPVGFESDSRGTPLPIGLMLGAPPYAEHHLLSVAAGYQARTDWHRRRPSGLDDLERPPAHEDRGRLDVQDVMDFGE